MRRLIFYLYSTLVIGLSLVNFAYSQEDLVPNDKLIVGESNGKYNGMSDREIEQMHIESCLKEYTASCFQLYEIYQDENRSKAAMSTLKRGCNTIEVDAEKKEEDSDKKKNNNSDETDEEKPVENSEKCNLYKEIKESSKGSISNFYLKKACPNPKTNVGEKAACDIRNEKDILLGSQLIYYTALALIFLAVFLISKTIFQEQDQHQVTENLDESNKNEDLNKLDFIIKISRPFFRRYFVPIVNGMKNRKSMKEKYKRPIAAAGLTGIVTPEDFFAFKLFLIFGFPIVFVLVRAFMEADWSLGLIPVAGIVGFYYPDLWISGRVTNRQKDIVMNMPFGVDMLALSVEAGLDFIAAMAKVIEKSKKNALAEEFEIVIKEIKIGASRGEALRNLAWRVDLIQVSSFCATLIAADSVGASIGPILKALALEIRQKKSAEVEKAGATAATKILFPMMFLIVPSVLIIVFSPIILEMVYGK